MNNDFVIRDVKFFKPSGEVDFGNIHVTGNKISAITQGEVTAQNVIDGRNKFATPGLVNAHTHAAMSLMRGIGDGENVDQLGL